MHCIRGQDEPPRINNFRCSSWLCLGSPYITAPSSPTKLIGIDDNWDDIVIALRHVTVGEAVGSTSVLEPDGDMLTAMRGQPLFQESNGPRINRRCYLTPAVNYFFFFFAFNSWCFSSRFASIASDQTPKRTDNFEIFLHSFDIHR